MPDANCTLSHLLATSDTVWGWGNCGLWQFDVSRQKWAFRKLGPHRATVVVVDTTGTVYAAGPNGLSVYLNPGWRQVTSVDVTAAAADKQGGLWLASRKQGILWYYRAGQLTNLGRRFRPNGLWYLMVDSQNRLWAAYSDRLLRDDRGERSEWQAISSPVFDIDRVAAGPDGRIWVTGRHSTAVVNDAAIAVYDPAAGQQP